MVDPDYLLGLERKLLELKRYRDALQKEVAAGAKELTAREDDLRRLSELLDSKRKAANNKLAAGKRIDKMIADAQTGLQQLSKNAERLASVLDNELQAVMSQVPP